MSFAQLLATGKSLVGVKDLDGRYQMRSQYLLPKFGSPKNPFGEPAKPRADRLTPGATPRIQLPAQSTGAAATAHSNESSRLPATGRIKLKIDTSRPVWTIVVREVSVVWNWIAGCSRKLSLLAQWKRRKPSAKPAASKSVKLPIQGELSLDSIKVARNDLSDADLEIVAKTPVAQPRVKPAMPAPATAEPAGTAWGRMASRVLGKGAAG
jgi:hypothetical protein